LLDAGAHPDARTRASTPDHARATALHVAAAWGHASVVRLLIDAGAEVDVLDADGMTPRQLATEWGDIVAMLDAAGATPRAGRADAP
jgi:ankyrin repeat protein